MPTTSTTWKGRRDNYYVDLSALRERGLVYWIVSSLGPRLRRWIVHAFIGYSILRGLGRAPSPIRLRGNLKAPVTLKMPRSSLEAISFAHDNSRRRGSIIRTIAYHLALVCKPFADALSRSGKFDAIDRDVNTQIRLLIVEPWQASEAARRANYGELR